MVAELEIRALHVGDALENISAKKQKSEPEGFEPPTHGTGNRLADTGVPWLA